MFDLINFKYMSSEVLREIVENVLVFHICVACCVLTARTQAECFLLGCKCESEQSMQRLSDLVHDLFKLWRLGSVRPKARSCQLCEPGHSG